jgi:hypothetical protein
MAFWFCLALVVLLALVMLAAISRVKVRVRYSRSGENDQLVVVLRALFGAYRYHVVIPAFMVRGWNLVYGIKSSQQFAGQQTVSKPEWRVGAGVIRRLMSNKWLRASLKTVECTRFRLDMRVGTGDALLTGICSGLFWTLYGCAVALTSQTVTLKTRPYGGVAPVFGSTQELSVVWEADFRVRTGTFVWALLKNGGRTVIMRQSWKNWRNWVKRPQSA